MKDVVGYEGVYRVAEDGNVYSVELGRNLKATLHANGRGKFYLRVRLKFGGKFHGKYVHRLVAEAYLENIEAKPTVNHIDGNTQNNSLSNLEWATHAEQSEHAIKLGLITRVGEKACGAKLTQEAVNEIRKRYVEGEYQKVLAKEFGVSQALISVVVNRKQWKRGVENE